MERSDLLKIIHEALKQRIISEGDLRALITPQVATAHPTTGTPVKSEKVNFSDVLYYVGGGIVVIGIGIFTSNHWQDMTSALRILVTLGMGFAAFVSAVLLAEGNKLHRIPEALHLIAGLLIPGGVFITLDELGFHGGAWGPGLIFIGFTLLYVLAYYLFHRAVIAIFAILYGTMGVILLTDAFDAGLPVFSGDDFVAYRILGIGLAYLFLAHGFTKSRLEILSWWLYGIGSLATLASALYLSGWKPEQSVAWELFYPVLVFGAMFLGILLRSRAMLFFGAAFLVGYIFKITGEYFQDSLSWPLLLILAGFLLIGVGYLTFYLNKRYLKNTATTLAI